MFKARTIKKQVTIQAVCSLILFYGTMMLFSVVFSIARDVKGSSSYFWSSDVREVVREGLSFFSSLALFCLFGGVVTLCLAISGSKLRKTGKVCPNCEFVHSNITIKCPKCGADLANAKNVDEYLAENPTVPKSTPSAGGDTGSSNTSNTEDKTEDKAEAADRRFCGQCGKKIKSGDAFCPHCGAKQ